MATDGMLCRTCEKVFCNACGGALSVCNTCRKTPNGSKLAASPSRKAPPPLKGEGGGNTFQGVGGSFIESQYVLARRHNFLRWGLSMGIGIPVFVVMLVTLGVIVASLASLFVLPAIYGAATSFFPGSKLYGSVLYKKYEQKRTADAFKRKLDASRSDHGE